MHKPWIHLPIMLSPQFTVVNACNSVGGTFTTSEDSLSRIPVGVSTIIVTFNMPCLYWVALLRLLTTLVYCMELC